MNLVKIIRQKIIPLQKNTDNQVQPLQIVVPTLPLEEGKGTRYIGIDNTDLQQRVQHTIRNLMELDDEELAYIEDMNCRNMFEIVLLLNNVVATLVEIMMTID
jgi:hypothetical protein